MTTRSVVILPGRAFGPFVPQLFFPMFAAMHRGAQPVPVVWGDGAPLPDVASAERESWVRRRIEATVPPPDPATTVVVGKSLGSYGAAWAADLGLPAIWVTPLLVDAGIVTALRRAAAPFLLVGGTADESWDGALARELSPHVLEVQGADHGLFVTGPLVASAAAMGELATASEAFLDEAVWPRSSV